MCWLRAARSCLRPTARTCPPTHPRSRFTSRRCVRARRLCLLGFLARGSAATGADRRLRRGRGRRRAGDRSPPADSRAAAIGWLTVSRDHASPVAATGRVRRRRRSAESARGPDALCRFSPPGIRNGDCLGLVIRAQHPGEWGFKSQRADSPVVDGVSGAAASVNDSGAGELPGRRAGRSDQSADARAGG
jgi:hypothetical protein